MLTYGLVVKASQSVFRDIEIWYQLQQCVETLCSPKAILCCLEHVSGLTAVFYVAALLAWSTCSLDRTVNL